MARPTDRDTTPGAGMHPTPPLTTERTRQKQHGTHKKAPPSILSFLRSTPSASPTSPAADDTVPFPDVQNPDDDLDYDLDLELELDDDDEGLNDGTGGLSLARSTALAAALGEAQERTRRRKGSLRKAALLGTGRLRMDRRSSGADITKPPRSPTKMLGPGTGRASRKASLTKNVLRDGVAAGDASSIASAPIPVPMPISVPAVPAALGLGHGAGQGLGASLKLATPQSMLMSPLTSPIEGPYASATSDDDAFSSLSGLGMKPSPSPSPPSSESSMTNPSFSLGGRRATASGVKASPLSAHQPDAEPVDEWDYSATEWWGWIILLVTWIVFVVGMGSCLEVWSWAWDVGETPYAPPELEDDPTLPIVGYYPALIILTAVMSWVWVVVAWMGMKYFKHARTHEL